MPSGARWLISLVLSLAGCGFGLQQASVSRSFADRFGCQASRMQRVSDGYHVEGCGRSAEYVCFPEYNRARPAETSIGGAFVSALIGGAIDGNGERCVFASSERFTAPAVVVSQPSTVARISESGRDVLKTRVLYSGGSLRALAAPRTHPEHALLIVHSVMRMQDPPCRSAIFHDGVPVPVLQQAREGRYDARLVVPISVLKDAAQAVRFSGTICGSEFDLNPSARATLGLFAARFAETRAHGP
jgi:hypothetical protein